MSASRDHAPAGGGAGSGGEAEGAENRPIELKLGPETMKFTGTSYLATFVLPNFFFHVTTAYNTLRHNGLAIGKRDFLGGPASGGANGAVASAATPRPRAPA